MSGILIGSAITSGFSPAALGIQFATVEAGVYPIGSDRCPTVDGVTSLPKQFARIERPFGIATTPFTNEQFRKVLAQFQPSPDRAPQNAFVIGELPDGTMKLIARGTAEEIKGMSQGEKEKAVEASFDSTALATTYTARGIPIGRLSVLENAWENVGPIELKENYYQLSNEQRKTNFAGDYQPVTMISWYESTVLALLLGCRLLSEIEWEAAARGKKGLEYATSSGGMRDQIGKKLGHFDEAGSVDVASYPPIHIGGISVYDLFGNVGEWTGSLYQADRGNRIVRGSMSQVGALHYLAANRSSVLPTSRSPRLGFRLAL